jgi:uncharacterized protein
MHPDLVKLLDLQARDEALLAADRALDSVLAEVEALDRQVKDTEQGIEQARRAVTEAQRRRAEVEAKMENYKKLEERGRQRLEQVKSPREIQAVMTEMDLARSVLQKEEADWIKLADVVAGHEHQVKEGEKRLAQLQEEQEAPREALRVRLTNGEAARQAARQAREKSAAEVNRALRGHYERLRQSRKAVVVVALSGPACGACHTAVPLNRRSQIQAGTLIDSCESCGVILYAAESGE